MNVIAIVITIFILMMVFGARTRYRAVKNALQIKQMDSKSVIQMIHEKAEEIDSIHSRKLESLGDNEKKQTKAWVRLNNELADLAALEVLNDNLHLIDNDRIVKMMTDSKKRNQVNELMDILEKDSQ